MIDEGIVGKRCNVFLTSGIRCEGEILFIDSSFLKINDTENSIVLIPMGSIDRIKVGG
jgi:hypothetical protein